MSHVRWTRTGRSLLAAGIAVCVWCTVVPSTAQDVQPPPSGDKTDIVDEEPQPSRDDVPEGTDSAPPESKPVAPEAPDTGEPTLAEPVVPAPIEESPPPADVPAPVEPAPAQPMIPLAVPDASPPPASPIGGSAEAAQQVAPTPPSVPPPVAPSPTPWSFALTAGYYYPRLGTLNRVLTDTSITIMQDPNFLLPRNQNLSFEQRNLAVEGIEGGPTYGVDTFYNTGGAHSFGLSFSSWRGETFGQDTISLFLRSNRDPIDAPRSARYNLILDQIFLEWRYHLFRTPEGKGLYLNAGLVGISLAFLTMDSLVNVVDPDLSFASVSSDESFGWGYTTRFGVGGDYPLTSWLSIGGRANYILGNIREMKVTRHFSAGFPQFPLPNPLQIRPGVPLPQLFFTPREGRTVSYAAVTTIGEIQEEAGIERVLTLELSGWEGLIELAVHF